MDSLSGEDRAAYDAAETAEEKLWFIDDKRIIEHMTTEQLARLAQLDDAIDEANSALESGIEYDSDTKMQLLQALSDAYAARAEFVISLATDDDLGYYGLVLQWAKDISGVTDCSYDCSDDLSALPRGSTMPLPPPRRMAGPPTRPSHRWRARSCPSRAPITACRP